ncbi:spindle pole body-associated sad1 protein [Rutstroemia sp. NJR-2017a WRK4]|nr:spindle pole body-associated sad1 protein [Rutstroemia sp. NJR-2017a WRK4]
MSTRRSTRAGSRAASSRGAPSVNADDIIPTSEARPTPGRRTRRNDNLPAVSSTTSTAYGTNTLAAPRAVARGAPLAHDISEVITGLLEPPPVAPEEPPTPEVEAPSRRAFPGASASAPKARSKTGSRRKEYLQSAPDRNFQNETGIFDNASINSSSLLEEHYNRFPGPIEEAEIGRRAALQKIAEEQQYVRGNERREPAPPDAYDYDNNEPSIATALFNEFSNAWNYVHRSFMSIFKRGTRELLAYSIAFLIGAIILTSYANSDLSTRPRFYGWDLKHNLGQFVPSQVLHPGRLFAPGDLKELYRRMDIADSDIAYLKRRSDVDQQAIERIKNILPDYVALDKDARGNPVLPENLWHAIRAKIRGDTQPIDHSPGTSGGQTAMTVKEWDRYLERNKVKIQSWSGSELDSLLPAKIAQLEKDGRIASRDEVVHMIAKNFKDSRVEIQDEIERLAKDLEEKSAKTARLLSQQVLTKDQVRQLVKEITGAQIAALANTNLNAGRGKFVQRVNHFSPSAGAAVEPTYTSPDYVPPGLDHGSIVRGFSKMFGQRIPVPNGPITALTKWEEYGECWCSPHNSKKGLGVSLGVITPFNIWPDQIVVEHYPQKAALVKGTAPRDMELFAYISSKTLADKIRSKSKQIFSGEEVDSLEQGWVRIASWTFDADSDDIVQAFPVQLDLKDFVTSAPDDLKSDLAATNKFIVRAKNKSGDDRVPYICIYRVKLHGDVKPDEPW